MSVGTLPFFDVEGNLEETLKGHVKKLGKLNESIAYKKNKEVHEYFKSKDTFQQNPFGLNPLIRATIYRQIDVLPSDPKFNINDTDANGMTALMYASLYGYYEIVSQLITIETDVNKQNNEGQTAAALAAASGSIKSLESLAGKSADLNIADKNGMTPIMWACACGQIDTLKYLYEIDSVEKISHSGLTLLMIASKYGCKESVDFLLEKSVDVNEQDYTGNTALMYACQNDYDEIVLNLKEHGAKNNIKNVMGRTALMIASQYSGSDVLNNLKIDPDECFDVDVDGKTLLMFSCIGGKIENVKLFSCINDMTALANNGYSAFLYACESGNLEIVDILYNYNNEIVKLSKNEYSPIEIASMNGHDKVVDFLMDKRFGSKRKMEEELNISLTFACKNGYDKVAQILLCHMEKVNFFMNKIEPNPLLTLAVASKNVELVRLLLSRGALVDKPGENKETPLILACRNGSEDIVRLLIQNKANVNAKNEFGDTPLIAACSSGNMSIIELLFKEKANLNDRNNFQETALHIAVEHRHVKVVEFLLNHNVHPNNSLARKTPLHIAALLKPTSDGTQIKLCKLLVDKNADKKKKDNMMRTPAMCVTDPIVRQFLMPNDK